MSDYATLVAVRAVLLNLQDFDEHQVIDFFAAKLGQPDEEPYYYDPDEHEITPVYDWKNKIWGVQKIIVNDSLYECSPAYVSFDYLDAARQSIMTVFPTASNFIVAAYNWYTGTDEPISLVPNFVP